MAYTYESVAPMASVTTPSYSYTASDAPKHQGLMGGDYEAYQKALYDPAAQAAKAAFDQQSVNLNNTMGGRGLYGSSIMQNQATDQLGAQYQNTLANAASKAAQGRYEMQANQLNNQNSFNKDIYGLGLQRESTYNQYGLNKAGQDATQNANLWKAAESEAARKQGYYQTQDELALNYQKLGQQQQQINNANTAGWMGMGGTALGGLLSSNGRSALSGVGSGLSSLYNTISGWLGGTDHSSFYDANYNYGGSDTYTDGTDWTNWG